MKYIEKKNALRICYYLMAADGVIRDEEREKFNELGYLLDDDKYDTYKDDLLWQCGRISLTSPEGDHVFNLMDAIGRELKGITESSSMDTIPGRLLVWNMLTIALCDKDYDEGERRLIEEVVRRMDVDATDFKEMEQTLVAANAAWLEEQMIREREAGNPDVEYQLKNLKERSRVIEMNAKEHMRTNRSASAAK
jgi:hypothetical protein